MRCIYDTENSALQRICSHYGGKDVVDMLFYRWRTSLRVFWNVEARLQIPENFVRGGKAVERREIGVFVSTS